MYEQKVNSANAILGQIPLLKENIPDYFVHHKVRLKHPIEYLKLLK